jgi:hypothetical protein
MRFPAARVAATWRDATERRRQQRSVDGAPPEARTKTFLQGAAAYHKKVAGGAKSCSKRFHSSNRI